MSMLQHQRFIVDQLHRELLVKRINVSQAVEDLKRFVMENQKDDCLVVGFHPPKTNLYRDKGPCKVL